MAQVTPVTPNIPLLGSGILALLVGVALPVFVMDFAHPDLVFAGFAIVMVLIGIYGIVATLLGLATVLPGVSR